MPGCLALGKAWHPQLVANGPACRDGDLSVPGHGCALPGSRIQPDAVAASLSKQLAPVLTEVTHEKPSRGHEATA